MQASAIHTFTMMPIRFVSEVNGKICRILNLRRRPCGVRKVMELRSLLMSVRPTLSVHFTKATYIQTDYLLQGTLQAIQDVHYCYSFLPMPLSTVMKLNISLFLSFFRFSSYSLPSFSVRPFPLPLCFRSSFFRQYSHPSCGNRLFQQLHCFSAPSVFSSLVPPSIPTSVQPK